MSGARAFALAWLAALLCTWWLRPPLPPDELRYLSVAWEMHDGGHWLVPHLNGEPYSHKPPLMFWLWRLAWLPFGPSLLAARLLQALAGALALALTMKLARALAPEDPRLPATAALVVGGSLALQAYSGFLGFDLWLSVLVLCSWLGLTRAIPPPSDVPARPGFGWTLFALGLGAAILTKGPAALLAVLPPALLHPWWSGARDAARARWLGLSAATLAGCALALAWALPAARAGGEEYGRLILWGQTAGRVQDSFAHARPFWFFLLALPALLLPWSLLPGCWRRGAGARAAERFALAAVIPGVLGFSLISGKQPHYLLPLVPACALFLAARLHGRSAQDRPPIARWALAMPALAVCAHLGFGLAAGQAFDLRGAAAEVAQAQSEGRAVALYGMAYHGQFHFLGRLRAPLADPPGPRQMQAWIDAHPEGMVLLVRPRAAAEKADAAGPVFAFGSRVVEIRRAGDLSPLWPPARVRGAAAPGR